MLVYLTHSRESYSVNSYESLRTLPGIVLNQFLHILLLATEMLLFKITSFSDTLLRAALYQYCQYHTDTHTMG